MPFITYPNVPNAPGVPNVLRKLPAGPPAILGSIAGIAQLIRAFTSVSVWGVFRADKPDGTTVIRGKPVVQPDSILELSYSNKRSVSTAPTQNGGFADYNRVNNPFEITLRMSKGGTEKDRTTFIKQIESLDSTEVFDIFSPEKVYKNVNMIGYNITREGVGGACFLSQVDIMFREVRIVSSKYINTTIPAPINPSAANPQNIGTQQSQIPVSPPSVAATVGAPGNIGQ